MVSFDFYPANEGTRNRLTDRNETLAFSVGPETLSFVVSVLGKSPFILVGPTADVTEKHNFGKDIEIGEADVDVRLPYSPR